MAFAVGGAAGTSRLRFRGRHQPLVFKAVALVVHSGTAVVRRVMTSIVHTGRAAVGRRPHALRMLVLEHASFLGRLVSGILDAKLLRRLDHRGQQAALLVGVERELLFRSHRRRVKRRCLLMVVVAADTGGSIRTAVLQMLLLLDHVV